MPRRHRQQAPVSLSQFTATTGGPLFTVRVYGPRGGRRPDACIAADLERLLPAAGFEGTAWRWIEFNSIQTPLLALHRGIPGTDREGEYLAGLKTDRGVDYYAIGGTGNAFDLLSQIHDSVSCERMAALRDEMQVARPWEGACDLG